MQESRLSRSSGTQQKGLDPLPAPALKELEIISGQAYSFRTNRNGLQRMQVPCFNEALGSGFVPELVYNRKVLKIW